MLPNWYERHILTTALERIAKAGLQGAALPVQNSP
jgi:hypothetical protein